MKQAHRDHDPSDRQRFDPRNRITSGITTSRLRMEARRAVRPGVVLVLALVLMVGLMGYLISQISETFGSGTRTVRFATPTSFGVFEGFDEVRYRGVPAGNIKSIERDGSRVILVASIRKEFGPIFKDARAELRPITPLNDVYLDIVDQGTERAGAATEKDVLPESQTLTSVSIPDVLDTFQVDERRNFHILLNELGNGTADRGASLRAAFAAAVPLLQGAGKLTEELAVRKQATKRLIHNASVLTEELAFRESGLRRLTVEGAKTLSALQQGSPDLDATLRELGPTFTELRASLASVRGVLADVDTGIESLYPVADRLPTGLGSLRDLGDTLAPTMRSLKDPIKEIAPVVTSARPVVRDLRDVSSLGRTQIPVFEKITKDLVACEPGVIGFFQWNASLSKFGDANAPAPRGTAALGVPPVGLGEPLREFHKSCTPGPIARNVITAEDEH